MDMGKYVAVGVLAVIVLAAVTYQAPKTPGGVNDPQRISGVVGPRSEAPVEPGPPPPTSEPEIAGTSSATDVAPTATATTTVEVATTALQSAAPEVLRYTVKAGQTLSDVAGELLGNRGRWRELYNHNKDQLPSPDVIRAGLILVFPQGEVARGTSPTSPAATTLPAGAPRTTDLTAKAGAGERTYTVARGDTLFSIARRELGQGSRWHEIVNLNKLSTETVAAGTHLRLPTH